ncbi:MAG: TRAP transporter small permease [Desulfatiglandales bacterium]
MGGLFPEPGQEQVSRPQPFIRRLWNSMKLTNQVARIFDRAIYVGVILASILLAFMMLSIAAEVVMRRIFNRPLMWVTDISEYTLLYVTFLGAAWVLKNEGHVRLDLVLSYLKPKSRATIDTMAAILGAMICLVVTWQSGKVTLWAISTGIEVMKAIQIARWIPLIVIPIGSFLLSIEFMRMVFRGRTREGVPKDFEQSEGD